jgi:dTMP kinase
MDLFSTREILTVTELTRQVQDVLEATFDQLWVEGEISNLRRPASGHLYFTLKDEDSQIRAVLFNPENTDMQLRAEILLFQAARAQLVEQVIRPRLALGGIVISDRYADSTLAYQGYGYGREVEPLRALIDFATVGLKPDLTLFLDLEVEEGLRRRASGGQVNRLDAYDLNFYRRVRQGYFELVNLDPPRWVVIDANRSPQEVQADVRAEVLKRLN